MVSDRIKHLREQNGLTQSELARKLKITRSSVNAWEMGISVPSTQLLVDLANIFHVSTDFLLGLADKATIDVSGLSDKDIELVTEVVSHLRAKNESGK